jgi:NitT/TauT family transport system substrate-binding protein
MSAIIRIDRRGVMRSAAAGLAGAALGLLASIGASAQGKPVVNLQPGRLLSGNQIGQAPSSSSLILAASPDIPVKCFAAGAQHHPCTFFSLKRNPVKPL